MLISVTEKGSSSSGRSSANGGVRKQHRNVIQAHPVRLKSTRNERNLAWEIAMIPDAQRNGHQK